MNNVRQWYCRTCKAVKERAAFPRHIDANTPCLECQGKAGGRSIIEGDLNAGAAEQQPVFVRRRFKTPKGPNRDKFE